MEDTKNVCSFCSQPNIQDLQPVNSFPEKSEIFQIKDIIMKHFWFSQDELEAFVICATCSNTLLEFHVLYCQVERLYTKQPEYPIAEREDNLTVSTTEPTCDRQEHEVESITIKSEFFDEFHDNPVENNSDDALEDFDETGQNLPTTDERNQGSGQRTKRLSKQDILRYCRMDCQVCAKRFEKFNELKQHYNNDHNQVGFVMCCGVRFEKYKLFRLHIWTHVDPASVKCPQCGKSFNTKKNLKHHLVRHKEEKMVITCDICGKRSPNSHALRKHIKDQHNSERSHQCTFCEKAFKRAFSLKEHMTIHTGEMLYSCAYCDKQFNSSANFSAHLKRDHPMEWQERQQRKAVAITSV